MAESINTLRRLFYIDQLGLPADTDMTLNDLMLAYYSDPPAGGGGPVDIADLPAGSLVVVKKAAGIWPGGDADTGVRPTTRTDITVAWQGADPSPAIVGSGTGGMYEGDVRWITT
jgi:hypothetical protein